MTIGGWAQVVQDRTRKAWLRYAVSLAALRATGAALRLPYYLALLAEACGQTGQAAEGLTLLAEALTQAHKTGESQTGAEIHRLKGQLLLSLSTDYQAEAEACWHQALAVARHQQAKSLELQADDKRAACGSSRASGTKRTACWRPSRLVHRGL